MTRAYDALFSEEPFRTFQDCFNVRYVVAVSRNEGFVDGGYTAFSTTFGEGTFMAGNDEKVVEYASEALSAAQLDNAMLIVLANKSVNAGTCYMYNSTQPSPGDHGEGMSVSYFARGTSSRMFANLIIHESVGHGFAKLADEYSYPENGEIPSDEKAAYQTWEPYGWWKNVDFTDNPASVKWAPFIADARYSAEQAGIFAGGFEYPSGVWHSTADSRMNTGEGHFNAVSRFAIWYRIQKLAYGTTGTFEDFVTYDAPNQALSVYRPRSQREHDDESEAPLHFTPPVVRKR